ncbi:MAG: protein-glutamate O-methyltransferase CheR, partial [Fibrobacteria bacterium]
ISDADFNFVSDLLLKRIGFRLEKDKGYLVESRFSKLAEKAGLKGAHEFIAQLRANCPESLIAEAVEAMTTNETYFFRDNVPFQTLRDKALAAILPRRAASKSLNIWSAACSTGQEPYSIAITLKEGLPQLADWSMQIFATDVNNEVLAKAREGAYNHSEISRGIGPELLQRYFTKTGQEWKIHKDMARNIRFQQLNLCQAWPAFPKMDVIFLRNVLIYMSDEAKKSILARVHGLLRPDGFLFLGAAESTFNLADYFVRTDWERSGCFRPRGPA